MDGSGPQFRAAPLACFVSFIRTPSRYDLFSRFASHLLEATTHTHPKDAPFEKALLPASYSSNKETHLHDQVNDPTGSTAPSSSPATTPQAPDFKQVRKYLRNIQQREALDGFIKAGWSPAELAEFARQVFLAPGKTYPTAASYQYATEKGADHPFAVETLASLRAPGFTLPPFNRPRPPKFEWDAPENPEHTVELRADIEVMARLWRTVRHLGMHGRGPWRTNRSHGGFGSGSTSSAFAITVRIRRAPSCLTRGISRSV